jgi:hypothetical protein
MCALVILALHMRCFCCVGDIRRKSMEELVVMLEAKLENDEVSFDGAVNKTGSPADTIARSTLLGQQS